MFNKRFKVSKFIGKTSRKHDFGHQQTRIDYVMAYIHKAKEKKENKEQKFKNTHKARLITRKKKIKKIEMNMESCLRPVKTPAVWLLMVDSLMTCLYFSVAIRIRSYWVRFLRRSHLMSN